MFDVLPILSSRDIKSSPCLLRPSTEYLRNEKHSKGRDAISATLSRLTPHDNHPHLHPIWGGYHKSQVTHKWSGVNQPTITFSEILQKCISNSSRTGCRHCDHASQRRGEPLKKQAVLYDTHTHPLSLSHRKPSLATQSSGAPPSLATADAALNTTHYLTYIALSGWLHKLALQPLIVATTPGTRPGRGGELEDTNSISKHLVVVRTMHPSIFDLEVLQVNTKTPYPAASWECRHAHLT